MVRRSYVATGNGHYTSNKLVAVRHSECDRVLGAHTTRRNARDGVVLLTEDSLSRLTSHSG